MSFRLSALMDTPSQQNLNQLPIGSPLGDFTITGIVGEGGFGIVYLAYEAALDRMVAIKEYLPSSIAGRTGNQSVMVRSQLNTNAFASGLKNFLREAQMLAKFSHPALVEVHRVWEQNATAYMAMRYYEGKTLREWRLSNEDFDELRIRRLLEPVIDALSLLHAQNVIHRDVSPDNILMRGSGTPVLLDLGAARLVIGGMTQALTTILKPGYAPIEQYVDDGTMHQGPWTDVYGIGAVLYYMLTGVAPPQAVARMITDPIRNMTDKLKVAVPPAFIDTVIKALAVRPENRFQSVDDLRDALGWTEPLPAEPRTQYTRTAIPARVTSGAAALPSTAAPPQPTVVVRAPQQSAPLAPPPLVAVTMPPMTVVIPPAPTPVPAAAPAALAKPAAPVAAANYSVAVDEDKTVVWNAAAVAAAARTAADENARALASSAAKLKPKAEPQVVSARIAPVSAVPPPVAIAASRAASYGDAPVLASGGKTKMWLFIALAAGVAAIGGYFAMSRSPAPTPTVAPTLPTTASPNSGDAPSAALIVTPAAPLVAAAPSAAPAPAPSPAAAAATAAVTPPVKSSPPASAITAPAIKPIPDAKDAARIADEEKLAKAKREAQDKTKADALEKAAKTKSDNDERIRKQKQEADDRATAARLEQDEKARRAREEEDRLDTAAKAKQEAERQKSAAVATPSGMVVTPPRRTVEELSASGNAAFKRGELAAARAAWNELVTHPEATARSKAVAYNNLAVSFCQNGDDTNCERMYASMLRADRAYGSEISERDMPQFKRAYDRAARVARVPGY